MEIKSIHFSTDVKVREHAEPKCNVSAWNIADWTRFFKTCEYCKEPEYRFLGAVCSFADYCGAGDSKVSYFIGGHGNDSIILDIDFCTFEELSHFAETVAAYIAKYHVEL